MNPNEEKSSISATNFVKIGSVFPKKRVRVSTLVGRKIAKAGKKAIKSVFYAVKEHKDKRKTAVDAVNKHEDKVKVTTAVDTVNKHEDKVKVTHGD